jgi:amino acid transporter
MSIKESSKLAANSLGVGESIIIGTAGSAPAFSIAAATTTLVASVGMLAPASILYCGLIMFGISLAFIHLNKVNANAGASYSWISDIFNPYLGFFTGWAVLVSSALFMVSGSIPASTATLFIIAPDLVHSPIWVSLVSIFWITGLCAVGIFGIRPAAHLQVLMTGFEVLVLSAVIIAGLIQFGKTPVHEFSYSYFFPTSFSPSLFATGALTSIFLYWGWDVTFNLNEETKNTKRTPGVGAFWSVIIVILLFVCFVITALLVLSDTEIQNAGTGILFAVADKLFPKPWGYLAVISVMLSSIGNLQTNILQFTRTLFAEARDGVINSKFAELHPTKNTPWIAILFIWVLGVAFLLIASFFSSVNVIIQDSVDSIGCMVAFYYCITGFASAWYHRFYWKSPAKLFLYIVWPIVSALFLIFIVALSIPRFDWVTNVVGLGGIALGIIPMCYSLRKKPTHSKVNNKKFNVVAA